MRMTIKVQFGILFAVVFLISCVSAGLAIFELGKVRQEMLEVDEKWLPSTLEVAHMTNAVKDYKVAQLLHILSTEGLAKRKYEEMMAASIETFDKAYKIYKPLITPGKESETVEKIDAAWTDYQQRSESILQLSQANQTEAAADLLNGELAGRLMVLFELMEKNMQIQIEGGNNAASQGSRAYELGKISAGVTLLVSALSMLGMLGWIMSNILRSLRNIYGTYQISARKVTTSGVETREAVSSLVSSSEETSTQTKVIYKNASEASTYVSAVAVAVKELNISIGDISQSVNETNQCVNEAVKQAHDTQTVVATLGDAANQIGEVVQLITSLAEQTNLLALNAAIEAARAGEAGRGFAVVADEVKKLATNTSSATGTIKEQVLGIQSIAEQCTNSLSKVVGAIMKIQDNSTSVSAAIEEQSGVAKEITDSVTDAAHRVSQVETNMAGIEEACKDTNVASYQVSTSANNVTTSFEELRVQFEKEMKTLGVAVAA